MTGLSGLLIDPLKDGAALLVAAVQGLPPELQQGGGGGDRALGLMVGLVLASLISEDLALISGGILAAHGQLSFGQAVGAGFVGILGGDLLLYAAGRTVARGLLRRAPLRWLVSERSLARGKEWFTQHKGLGALLGSRFVPGLRLPTFVAAGALRAPFPKVFGLLSLAAALWVPLLVGLSMKVGERLRPLLERYERQALPWLAGLVLLLWLLLSWLLPLFSWEGRRRLRGRWLRLRHWEFWPMWRFYPPVLAHVLWLGLRHRGLTLFTLANPGLPAGGFIGESKDAIYRGLAEGAGEALLAYRLLPRGEPAARLAALSAWMAEARQRFPIVLKPDAGQRGTGVRIVGSLSEAMGYFDEIRVPVIAQEFAPGQEFGLFYVRHPDEAAGRLFSITDKRPRTVTGDGRHNLGQLILLSDDTLPLAARFEQAHAERLHTVPEPGEVLPLVDIGTHRLGAEFRDGAQVWTPELEAAVDRISRALPGFHFGRYDVRTPDLAAFRAGRGFKIVELNGVTAEATHIYDRRHSVWQAWAILREQWRAAFAIGAASRARGLRPTGLAELLRLLRDYEAAE